MLIFTTRDRHVILCEAGLRVRLYLAIWNIRQLQDWVCNLALSSWDLRDQSIFGFPLVVKRIYVTDGREFIAFLLKTNMLFVNQKFNTDITSVFVIWMNWLIIHRDEAGWKILNETYRIFLRLVIKVLLASKNSEHKFRTK